MTLLEEIKQDVDPQGWNTPNEFDDLLLKKHPLEYKPRKKDKIIRLSWSLLKLGLSCPRACTWTAKPDLFDINPNLFTFQNSYTTLRGNIAQTLLEHTYTHNYLALEGATFLKAYQASWRWAVSFTKPLTVISPEELLKLRGEVFSQLPTILKAINREGFWTAKQEVEKPLWWDAPQMPGVRFTGKADFVLSDSNKNWLIDGKWVNRPDTLDARQLTFYSLILQKMTGRLPTRTLFWCYPQDMILDPTADVLAPQTLASVMSDAMKVSDQIKVLDTTPSPSPANCRYCTFKSSCDASCWSPSKF